MDFPRTSPVIPPVWRTWFMFPSWWESTYPHDFHSAEVDDADFEELTSRLTLMDRRAERLSMAIDALRRALNWATNRLHALRFNRFMTYVIWCEHAEDHYLSHLRPFSTETALPETDSWYTSVGTQTDEIAV